MSGFVKVYSSILASSVWGESLATRVVWITMLAMADRNGCVEASSDGIARAANVTLKQADAAIEVLSSPDTRSKTQDDMEGRRIERIDGGYQILNYLKYRELQTPVQKQTAERQRRFREKHSVTPALRNGDKKSRNIDKRIKAEAEANTEADINTKPTTVSAKAEKRRSWVDDGVEWWGENVGVISRPRFGKAFKGAVVTHGWPKVFPAIKCYVADSKSRGKPARAEWCVAEIVRWIEWAEMPATDAEGLLTPRGKQITGSPV